MNDTINLFPNGRYYTPSGKMSTTATLLSLLLILPLAMPILIFGARTVSLVASGDGVAGGLYFLAAYAVLTLSFAPFATAAALRISNE